MEKADPHDLPGSLHPGSGRKPAATRNFARQVRMPPRSPSARAAPTALDEGSISFGRLSESNSPSLGRRQRELVNKTLKLRRRRRRCSGLGLALVASFSACTGGGTASDDVAGVASFVSPPSTEEDWLASRTLLSPADLPEGFELTPRLSSVPEQDPEVCDAFGELDSEFGEAVTIWGIAYSQRTLFDETTISQASFVWSRPIAVERMREAVQIAQACMPARVEANLRENLANEATALVSVTGTSHAVRLGVDAPAEGVRVEFILREAGIEYSTYYDFLYVAHERVIVLLEIRRQVDPPETSLEGALVRALFERLEALQ